MVLAYDLWSLREPFSRSTLRPLYPDQVALLNNIAASIRGGHRRIMVQAPTGFGKTLTAAHLIGIALERGNRALFVCPSIALVEKTLADFEAEGIRDIGIIQARHERTDLQASVQIASAQTLIRRSIPPEFSPIIIDEAHEQFEGVNRLLASPGWRDKVAIGLSATPWSRGLGLHWSELIIGGTTRGLIAAGRLCDFCGYGPGLDADLSNVRVTAGEYNESDLSRVMSRYDLVADVVVTWKRRWGKGKTFLFAVDRAHAAALREQFREAGFSFGYIDGNSTAEERSETFRRYRSGEDMGICSVGCLIRGIDEDVRCIIDAAPTRSEIRHVQKIGRGLRLAPGKDRLLILDHAGNNERLGFVTDIHHDTLDTRSPYEKEPIEREQMETGASRPKEKKPRKCRECGFLAPNGIGTCPQCGASLARPSEIETADGDLVEFGQRAAEAPKTARDRIAAMGKDKVFGMLLHHANSRGYVAGWASHKYKEIFGVWPRGLSAVPTPVSPELASWLKAQTIRWVKSKKRAAG